ncbi:hypothetical protein BURK1_01225 [Burkholderiales bacterium]|nr:hypothetical protein BURK1_01225 [Burkholderiales bacterium]
MRLVGVSMVRNEEDIIEAFVRHNLSVLDGLIVVDHGSADRTPAILDALCAEKLRLVVMRSDAAGYLQAEITTSAAREAFSRGGADAVFPLDADEFLRVGSRDALERSLEAVPPGHFGRVAWPTYVPSLDDAPGDIVAKLRASRRILRKVAYTSNMSRKIALTRHFALESSATITMGNHDVLLGRNQRTSPRMPCVDLPEDIVEICHVPVRSRTQFIVKTAIKRLARVAANRDYPGGAPIRRAFDAIARGLPLTTEVMLMSHVTWHPKDEGAAASLAYATDDVPIIADIALRHTPAAPGDPLPLVLSAVERLVRRAARSTGG